MKILDSLSDHLKRRFKDLKTDTGLSAPSLSEYLKKMISLSIIIKNVDGSYSKSRGVSIALLSPETFNKTAVDNKTDKYTRMFLQGFSILLTSTNILIEKMSKAKNIEELRDDMVFMNLLTNYIAYANIYILYDLMESKNSNESYAELKSYLDNFILPSIQFYSNVFRVNKKISRELLDSTRNLYAIRLQENIKLIMDQLQKEE